MSVSVPLMDGVESRLDGAWVAAFEQAWTSHRLGSIAVGAVLTDSDGAVVAADRNRAGEPEGPPGLLAGNRLAHAEVNVIARLGQAHPEGMSLLTTLQPCVLCAGACSYARVARVEYAGVDAAWDGVEQLHQASPVLVERAPAISWRDLGFWSVWAEAVPLSGVIRRYGLDGRVGRTYLAANAAMVDLATQIAGDEALPRLDLEAAVARWAERLARVAVTMPGESAP